MGFRGDNGLDQSVERILRHGREHAGKIARRTLRQLGQGLGHWLPPLFATTLAGVLPLGLIFNVLNFENGLRWISLSAYWQSVVRGVFLIVVVMASSGAARRVLRNG